MKKKNQNKERKKRQLWKAERTSKGQRHEEVTVRKDKVLEN